MQDRLKAAFDQIHADDALKTRTKQFIHNRTHGYSQDQSRPSPRWATLVACCLALLVVAGGYLSYTAPVAAISMDINPSIELSINVYNRVIDVKAYNEDGAALVQSLPLQHMHYADAINTILSDQAAASYLQTDDYWQITIVSGSERKNQTIRNCISRQTDISVKHIYCSSHHEDIAAAHAAGLSCGKYQALLLLQQQNPDITAADIQNLSMAEIRQLLQDSLPEAGQGHNQNNGSAGNHSGSHGHGQK